MKNKKTHVPLGLKKKKKWFVILIENERGHIPFEDSISCLCIPKFDSLLFYVPLEKMYGT